MDTQRLILFVIFSFSALFLWEAWQREHRPPPPPVTQTAPRSSAESPVPTATPIPGAAVTANPNAAPAAAPAGETVAIRTDLYGADITIGVDTALNIALESIDRLKVTASSHRRAFVVEVMGRNCGYLALMAGIAGGAESVVIPEAEVEPEILVRDIQSAYARGKAHALIIVAEGARNNATRLAEHFEAHKHQIGFDVRVTTLGHVQRGGTPGAFDRLLATRLASAAIEHLDLGEHGRLIGMLKGEVSATPLTEVVGRPKEIDLNLLKLQKVLAQ